MLSFAALFPRGLTQYILTSANGTKAWSAIRDSAKLPLQTTRHLRNVRCDDHQCRPLRSFGDNWRVQLHRFASNPAAGRSNTAGGSTTTTSTWEFWTTLFGVRGLSGACHHGTGTVHRRASI